MSSEHNKKLSRFAMFTVAVLILIGGVRVGLHVKGVVLLILSDEDTQQAESIKSCERLFGDWQIQSEEADPPVPSIVPKGQSRCQTWIKKGQLISDDFYIWHTVLWVVGALLACAPLLVVFLVFRRNTNAGAVMMRVFVVQLLAAVGEIDTAFRQGAQEEDLLLTLWPGIENAGSGRLFIDGMMFATLGGYVLLCFAYLWLALMVRSKRMWASQISTTPPSSEDPNQIVTT